MPIFNLIEVASRTHVRARTFKLVTNKIGSCWFTLFKVVESYKSQ